MSENFYIDKDPKGSRFFISGENVSSIVFDRRRDTECAHIYHEGACKDCAKQKPGWGTITLPKNTELGNHSLLALCTCAILAGTYQREGFVEGVQINGAMSTAKRVIEEARHRTVAPRIGPKPVFEKSGTNPHTQGLR